MTGPDPADAAAVAASAPDRPVWASAHRRLGRGGPLSRISIQSKLLVLLLLTSVGSAAIVGFIGFQSGRESLREAVFDQLTVIRESQARALEAQLADLRNSLVVYTTGSTPTEAIAAFSAGFDELADAPLSPGQQQSVTDYYNNDFRDMKNRQDPDFQVDVSALLPTSAAQRYLQAFYTAPFDDFDRAIATDDARDGSAWSAANARFNGYFREMVTRFDFDDALLIDAAGDVVYSAYKGVDLGTNILTGPYRETSLNEAYSEAMAANTVNYVGITDFGDYTPADEATAWLVAPIGAEQVQGVLALQFPITKLNELMTFGGDWQAAGMGRSGETYLVGPDDLMRSNSRLFVEDPQRYRTEVIDAGTPAQTADEALRQRGTTLVQPVASEATSAARRGQTGTLITTDYLGQRTLQAYAPLELDELRWSIVAEIDTAEAFAPVDRFTRTLVLSTAGMIFAVCIAALLLAQLFVRPIRRLEAGARQISSGNYDVALPVTSRDEFGDLTVAFNEMSRNLLVKEELLDEQRRENDRLLASHMPEAVIARYREGEETIAQDHQNVTVIFADVAGLDELSEDLTSDESLALVNRLVRQFDAAAEHLGVERVRNLRNGYLASCGLNVPRLDNVRRTVDFAADMARIVSRFNTETGYELRLRAGIDTGTVTSGLVGRSSMVYDMWGSAVSVAFGVQSGSSQPGVYVTDAVYDKTRDSRSYLPAGEVTVGDEPQPIWRLADHQL